MARALVALIAPSASALEQLSAAERSAIGRSVPAVLSLAAADSSWDVRPAFSAALRDYLRMFATNQVRVDEYLKQGGLFSESTAAVNGVPHGPITLAILWDLFRHPVKMAQLWRSYADAALKNPKGQGGFFFSSGPSPEDTLRELAKSAGVDLRGV